MFARVSRRYPTETRVLLPPSFKCDEKKGSHTFVDVRIGCCICSRGCACTLDVRFSKDYFSEYTALSDIDLRMPYYTTTASLEELDSFYEDSRIANGTWYVWKHPAADYVYQLRNMLRVLHTQDVELFHGGVSEVFDFSDQDVVAQAKNYYGDESTPDPNESTVSWTTFNFINKNEVTLCPGCYIWSSFVHPEYKKHFAKLDSFDLGCRQWLEEYEDHLITV